jgi:uridine kinase
MARGITPLMISIDDYYKGRHEAPLDAEGKPDLEHLEALDIDLFNEQMFALINGEEVTLPIFNFQTGKREWGKTVQIDEKCPILIEGIHALNDDLTPSIPSHQKYKIYIAPQAQLHLDDHNPISITDIRLLRRMVRDKKFRNSKAEETLSMWPSVRRGEFRWIYDNQEGVNFVFNSELTYELCVMKKYALPMLEEIDSESPYYIQANRLIKFLKYFKDIEDDWIPCNSILREFIGGSSFYKK